ncbi:hypothetical protein A374_10495 [Fictibacillus macauensis ZFHKF-1]|uniref:Haloacid dehalogenase n=1 Tax=Fictibacillus macauensis ZFHKF-1 TaxID=1196324 RepID=I8UE30_9BACL|nr:HAD hydrolase-like protein [Fictibacillus macauensis]EIT85165.1 hypothetical protein A374_10495 [Fictibacillus macauensis ZFHKF-1]
MMIDSIYWDLDDTLLNYNDAFTRAASTSFAALHPFLSSHDVTYWLPHFKACCDDYWPAYEKKRLSRDRYLALRFHRSLQRANVASAVSWHSFEAALRQQIPRLCTFFPGISDILKKLTQQAIPLGMITNGSRSFQQAKLVALQLNQWLCADRIHICEEGTLQKPNPQLFSTVQTIHNDKAPLYIGNSWHLDIVPARQAGWQTIWYAPSSEESDAACLTTPEALLTKLSAYIEAAK